MTKAAISGIAPLFIVKNVPATLAFYRDYLGFDVTFQGPEPDDIFFGIVRRGAAMLMFKDVGVDPVPNYTRDVKRGIARWDAYLHVPDPDALILAQVGAGGMGEVYSATDTRLHRTVAVKISSEKFGERFEREARAVAALNHPNISQIYDVGPNYLVMEYIEGLPLKGPLPLDQALKYAGQICDALDAAHTKSIVHRDLKPANILVTRSGVKLLDLQHANVGRIATLACGEPRPDGGQRHTSEVHEFSQRPDARQLFVRWQIGGLHLE